MPCIQLKKYQSFGTFSLKSHTRAGSPYKSNISTFELDSNTRACWIHTLGWNRMSGLNHHTMALFPHFFWIPPVCLDINTRAGSLNYCWILALLLDPNSMAGALNFNWIPTLWLDTTPGLELDNNNRAGLPHYYWIPALQLDTHNRAGCQCEGCISNLG